VLKKTIHERLIKLESILLEFNFNANQDSFLDTSLVTVSIAEQIGSSFKKYISLEDEIKMVLLTRIGARVMRPLYGSKLYELRDKKFNEEFKLLATSYILTSIYTNIELTGKIKNVKFEKDNDIVKMILEFEK